MGKPRYGVPVGRSGCRFMVFGSRAGERSFPLTRGGYGDAVRQAWIETTLGGANVGIELVCGPDRYRMEGGRRVPLVQCYMDKASNRADCHAPAFPSEPGARPMGGLRRRGRR